MKHFEGVFKDSLNPLDGLTVVEASTLFAGPLAGMYLGDYGAEVIKIEHPEIPDPARGHGPEQNGINLWSKTLGRNKTNITLDLSSVAGANVLMKLLKRADIFVENFRPGVLDKWGITQARMMDENPRLVIVRVTAFGQTGPYSQRPGFGTLAEAMSGFAATTGMPEGPPQLPPFGLADGVTGLAAAFASLVAVIRRDRTGLGGEVDISILEPMMMMMGPQISAFMASGYIQPRTGNRSASSAPRNLYKSLDGKWIAISTSSQSIAERVMILVGRPDVTSETWFSSGQSRAEHSDLLDEIVGNWVAARNAKDVILEFQKANAAAVEIYDVSQLIADAQVKARGVVLTVPDRELGEISMQNAIFKLDSQYPQLRWPGRPHGSNTREVLARLGLDEAAIDQLVADGVIK